MRSRDKSGKVPPLFINAWRKREEKKYEEKMDKLKIPNLLIVCNKVIKYPTVKIVEEKLLNLKKEM